MEFDIVSRHYVYRMLAEKRWNKQEETLHSYILNMQSLAQQG